MRVGYDGGRVRLTLKDKAEYCRIMSRNLPHLRKMLGLSQSLFGELCGISRARISLIERGDFEMSWTQFTSIFLIFIFNNTTKSAISKEEMFPDKLYKYLQMKSVGEAYESFIRIDTAEALSFINIKNSSRLVRDALDSWLPINVSAARNMTREELMDYMPRIYRNHAARISLLCAALMQEATESDTFHATAELDPAYTAYFEEASKYINIGLAFIPFEIWEFDNTNRDMRAIWERHIIDTSLLMNYYITKLSDSTSNPEERIILRMIDSGASSHHERWDGYGVPNGLKEDNISIIGRMYSICNDFDKIVCGRFGAPTMPVDFACKELLRHSGRIYDPRLVYIFVNNIEKFKKILGKK